MPYIHPVGSECACARALFVELFSRHDALTIEGGNP